MIDSIVKIGTPMRDVLEAIGHEPAGIAFFNSEDDVLAGILTDGDVRRLFLKGIQLDDKVTAAHLGDFVSAREGEDIENLLKKINKLIRIVPILNDEGQLVDYFRYEHKTKFIPVAEPSLKGNELKYVTDAVLSTWISSRGEYINRFEAEFAEYCGVEYGVAVSNGTVAIQLALKAKEIGPGDEVIVPDFTFAATINSVIHCGATPVIVDVLKETWCMDPAALAKAITPNTKAIIPVHIYGQACDMEAIMELASANDLFVLEDAAEAHGARYNGKRVGGLGHAATFSFFGNKIITCGEGGMVTTNDAALNDRMRVLRDHGMSKEKRYWHDHVGFNFRMTNVQAAIGCAQLEKIEDIRKWRSELEEAYKKVFSGYEIKFQSTAANTERAIWLISALMPSTEKRDSLIQHFRNHNVDLRPFFYPLSDMPIYQEYASHSEVASEISMVGVSLPTVEGMDMEEFKSILDSWK
jgi:perosamine synthetase